MGGQGRAGDTGYGRVDQESTGQGMAREAKAEQSRGGHGRGRAGKLKDCRSVMVEGFCV